MDPAPLNPSSEFKLRSLDAMSLKPMALDDPIDAYLIGMAAVVADLSRAEIWSAVDLLVDAGRRRARIYIVGNGGSAATASHMANDLCKQASVPGQPMLRAIALTDNMPLVTAWSNDADYAESFARQLVNHVEAGDLLVAISTSGNSPNVLRALELAREAGARTIGLTGREGGRMAALVDCCIRVPSDDIGQQEDAHLVVNHVLTCGIRARLIAD
jgi:D-sedoheptulose 7-phosphate isomerase